MPWGYVAGGVASAVAGHYLNKGSGGGGTSGGSAPPVYIPTNQAGMDTNFNTAYTNYLNNLSANQSLTSPYATSLFNSEMNNPYSAGLMAGAKGAGAEYGAQGLMSGMGASNLFDTANSLSQNTQQMQNEFNTNFGNVANAARTMYGMGNLANQNYGNLERQLGSQYNNVLASENNLNQGAYAVLNSAFDPQNALYNYNLGQLNDATNAAEYSRGIENTPYGASVQANADQQFQLNWQNQQLARQQAGLASAAGGYQNALGQGTNYTQAQSGLQTAQDANYANLANSATSMYANYLNAQAQNQNLGAQGLANTYNAASNLAGAAAGAYQNEGMAPYNAQNMINNNLNAAIGQYNANQTPYLSGQNQLMSNALAYMNFGQGAQNLGWSQNVANQNQLMGNMNTLGRAFNSSGAGNWLQNQWNSWTGGFGGGGDASVGQAGLSGADQSAIWQYNDYGGGV